MDRYPQLWLPVDDGLIAGPEHHLRDPRKLFTPELLQHVDGVLGFAGLRERCAEQLEGTPFVVNLTASTIRRDHTRKVLIGSAYRARDLDAAGVAVHLNLSSPSESEQLVALGTVVEQARDLAMPVLAIVYPRTTFAGVDDNYEGTRHRDLERYTALVRHGVRVAVELGADVVKTVYTDTVESFATVVDAAIGVPVLAAGGAFVNEGTALLRARGAVEAGAAGVAYGRQIFMRPDPAGFVAKLRAELDAAAEGRGRA